MKKYYADAWHANTAPAPGAATMCKECSMHVIKFYEGRSTTPQYASFIRRDEKGHLLINEQIDKPYGKRTARWLDPKDVRIEWIRNFGGVKAMEAL